MIERRIKNKNNKLRHGIHITHNDSDAVGCALVLSYFNPVWDFHNNTHFCAIGRQDAQVQDIIHKIKNQEEKMPEAIYISDISLSEDTCDMLDEFCKTHNVILHGFDHHKTNSLNEKYDWWTVVTGAVHRTANISTEISATLIMYNHFADNADYKYLNPEVIFPIVNLISDYDTWIWKKYPSIYNFESVNADIASVICSILKPEKMFQYLYEHYCDGLKKHQETMFPDLFYTLYDIEIVNRERYLKSLHYSTKIFSHNGFNFAMFICENSFVNAASEYIYTNFEFVDIVIAIYPVTKKISLRSNRPDIDLSQIAKTYYNGGGHKSAAGGGIENDTEFVDFLRIYYEKSVFLDEFMKTSILLTPEE
jgi:oligoribonuclease NrnB/cAMP/cGMP phosphodiesterase (DHH superfamily)